MDNPIFYKTFKKGSTTFFNSSLFFPKRIKDEVTILYAFVRIADDFVDQTPQDKEGFKKFREEYEKGSDKISSKNEVIDKFVKLADKRNFHKPWIDAFLDSMESDLDHQKYLSMKDTKNYIYGSANVIGFMMARIMELNDEAMVSAGYLGQAFQYINFIRDIHEDNELGRLYFPQSELKKYNLENLEKNYIQDNKENFEKFINAQINRYLKWQEKGEKGYKYIPKRFRIPIKTASDMYRWTSDVIRENPMIIYEEKVKPHPFRVKSKALLNFVVA